MNKTNHKTYAHHIKNSNHIHPKQDITATNIKSTDIKTTDIKTSDLYLAAYLLHANIEAKELITEGLNHKKVLFIFSHTKMVNEHIQKYEQNTAVVKARDFGYFVERAKDLMYSQLRRSTRPASQYERHQ